MGIQNDGIVTISELKFDGSTSRKKSVSYKEFVGTYSVHRKSIPTTLPYIEKGPHINLKWHITHTIVMATTAIARVSRTIGSPNVLVQSAPKSVFAVEVFKKGELVLPLTSSIVKCEEVGKASGVQMRGPVPDGHVLVIAPMVDNDMPMPAWYVRPVVEEDVNMKVIFKSVQITVTGDEGDKEVFNFEVPCYINTKPLKKGTEVTCLLKTQQKSKARSSPALVASICSVKKVKTDDA